MDHFTSLRKIFLKVSMSIAQNFVFRHNILLLTRHCMLIGMLKLKQYNPSKPVKYGLLYQSNADSVVPYTFLHNRMQENLKLKVVSFILSVPMSIVCI